MLFIAGSVAALLGSTSLLLFPTLPQFKGLAILFSILLFCLAYIGLFVGKHIKWLYFLFLLLFSLGIGFFWTYFHAQHKLADSFPIAFMHQTVEMQGSVVGLSLRSGNNLMCDVQIDLLNGEKRAYKVRLFFKKSTVLKPGDQIHAMAQLKPPWSLFNPGGNDLERQYFIEGIHAMGHVKKVLKIKASNNFSFDRLRQYLLERMQSLLGEKVFSGVLIAMTLGTTHFITPTQWEILQRTGTAHLMAISGAHIGFIAWFFFSLTTRLSACNQRLVSYYPASFYGAVAAVLSALCYSALAGFSVPTTRAFIMTTVAMGALILRRPCFSWSTLSWAWWGVFLFFPLCTVQVGFWLSFGCIVVLILGKPHYQKQKSRWRRWCTAQWILFIGLVPFNAFFFKKVPLLAPLVNLVALPLVGFFVVPFSLLAMFFIEFNALLADGILNITHEFFSLLWYFLEKISSIEWQVWEVPALSLCQFILLFLGACVLLLPPGFPLRGWGIFSFFPLFLSPHSGLEAGMWRCVVLDVGQGLAVIIQTKEHVLLYDTGPQYTPFSNAGTRVILPFLRYCGIQKIDKIILSHLDLDHRGGLNSLVAYLKKEIITSELFPVGKPIRLCVQGEHWTWDGVQFHLFPTPHQEKKRNNLSCVLKVSTPFHSVLLTGDIEQGREKRLLTAFSRDLKSDVVVVPHHGSLTSSSLEFVKAMAPRYAVYAVGFGNRYGFPKQAILHRYQSMGSENLIVSQTGALIFTFKEGSPLTAPIAWRDTARHYWNVQKERSER